MVGPKRTRKKRRPLDQQARYLWEFKLTTPGKGFLLFFTVAISVGASSLHIPVYQLVCALFSIFFFGFLAGWIYRPQLMIQGRFPDRAVVGQEVGSVFRVRNEGKRSAFDIGLRFFMLPRHLKSTQVEEVHRGLPSKSGDSLEVSLFPEKRGIYTLPVPYLYTTFPFNFFRTRFRSDPKMSRSTTSLLVVPSYHPLEEVRIPARRRYQPGGVPYSSHIGESMEYVGNREYRPGDSMQRIDFLSWGRISRPVVREYQEEYYLRIGLVLDTQVTGMKREPREGYPPLEAAISLTAAISDFLIRQDHVIDLFAAGNQVYRLTAGRHTAQLDRVQEILACLEPTPHNPFPTVNEEVGEYLSGISCLIGIFLSWDDHRETIIRQASAMGCGSRVILVEGNESPVGDPPGEPYQTFRPEEVLGGGVRVL